MFDINFSDLTDLPMWKRCTKCGETKLVSEFHKDSQRKGGLYHKCKACTKAYGSKRRAAVREAAAPCSTEGCDKIARRADMCVGCYQRDRYGVCVTGCGSPANGLDGYCWYHRDLGPCQHPDGCDNPAHARHNREGPLLCATHLGHARGRSSPSEHDRSNDQHYGYLWLHEDGRIAYVGITYKEIKHRTAEHLRDSWWTDNDVTPPTEPTGTFSTEAGARKWEEATIKAIVNMGGRLYNTVHNPDRGWWDCNASVGTSTYTSTYKKGES
jgi:hypothetical protein